MSDWIEKLATGQDAFTRTAAVFTMPAVGLAGPLNVLDTEWMAAGIDLFIEICGYVTIVSVENSQNCTVRNLGVAGNAAPSTTAPIDSRVTPAGPPGTSTGGGSGLVVTGTPQTSYVPTWSGAAAVWAPIDGVKVTGFSAATPVVETGQSVANPAFAASYTATPSAAVLTNDANGEAKDVHATPTSFASAQTYVKSTPNQAVTFDLTAALGALSAPVAACQIVWCQKNYWGVSSSPANTAAFIQALAGSALATARAMTFSVNAGGTTKIYFSMPSRYGTPAFSVGGFAGGFVLRAAGISVTNAQGFAESYDLWESTNAGLGTTTVAVS